MLLGYQVKLAPLTFGPPTQLLVPADNTSVFARVEFR